jgi:hypothetical protein
MKTNKPENTEWKLTSDGKIYRKGKKTYPNRDEYDVCEFITLITNIYLI